MDSAGIWTAPDGARIFYRLWRGGSERPVLVLLHGAASNSTRWSEFVRLTRLRDSWDLLCIDRRGQGQSVCRGPAGMREWCDDVAGILTAEGYARAVVGGHCLGANIAVEFAARHPPLASALVLVEPMPHEALAGTMARLARLRVALRALAAVASVLNSIGLYRRKLADLDLEALDRKTRAALAAGRSTESVFALYASPFLDLSTTPTASYLRDLLAVTAPLPPFAWIPVPVLALVSRDSSMTDPQRARRALAAFPSLTCVDIAARHWIPTEQPAEMRAAIESWLLATGACEHRGSAREGE